MAAAVIISLMALSLMVRFIMEKSWWRGWQVIVQIGDYVDTINHDLWKTIVNMN